jgi:hypothetical protein
MNTSINVRIPTDSSLWERIDVDAWVREDTKEVLYIKTVITIPDDEEPDVVCLSPPIARVLPAPTEQLMSNSLPLSQLETLPPTQELMSSQSQLMSSQSLSYPSYVPSPPFWSTPPSPLHSLSPPSSPVLYWP